MEKREIAGLSSVCKALSDPNRLRIVEMLSCGELCACRLLERFHITQPTLSHHMKVLTDCGIVSGRKDGVWTHYSLNRERLEGFIGSIRSLTESNDACNCRQVQNEPCCDGPDCSNAETGREGL